MYIINIVIIFFAGLTLGSGLMVFLRSRRENASQLFFFMTFFISLWSLSLFINNIDNPSHPIILLSRLAYIFGFIMVYLFWLFSLSYPYKLQRRSNLLFLLGIIYVIYLTAIIYSGNYFIEEAVFMNGSFVRDRYVEFQYYIFMIFILGYSLIGLLNLLKKTINSQGIHSHNSRIITISLAVAVIVITICDLVMPLYGNFSWNWVGVISLLPIVISTAYIMSKK